MLYTRLRPTIALSWLDAQPSCTLAFCTLEGITWSPEPKRLENLAATPTRWANHAAQKRMHATLEAKDECNTTIGAE